MKDHALKLQSEQTAAIGKEKNAPAENCANSTMLDILGALPGTRKDLSQAMQRKLEERFGVPLSGLKVYEDEGLAEIGQRAYAKGNEIHMAKGEYNPGSESGLDVLLHEAGHVVQQGSGMARGDGLLDNPALENQANVGFTAPVGFQMPSSSAGPVQGKNPFRHLARLLPNNMIQNHRDALDQLVEAKDDKDEHDKSRWDKLAWHKKARYAAANPLAWARSNTSEGKYYATKRKTERDEVAKMKKLMSSTDSNDKLIQDSLTKNEMTTKTLAALNGNQNKHIWDSVPGNETEATPELKTGSIWDSAKSASVQGNETDTKPELETGGGKEGKSGSLGNLGNIAKAGVAIGAPALAAAAGAGVLGGIGASALVNKKEDFKLDRPDAGSFSDILGKGQAGIGLISGGIGLVSSTVGGIKSGINTVNMAKQGDTGSMVDSGIDTVRSMAGLVGAGSGIASSGLNLASHTGAWLPGLGLVGSGATAVSGGLQAMKGGINLFSGGAVRSGMSSAQKELAELSPADDMEQVNMRDKMSGAFKMGHGTARINQAAGGFDLASGTMRASSGLLGFANNISTLTGFGAAAAPVIGGLSTFLGIGSTVTDKAGGLVTNKMKKNLRNRTISEEGGLDLNAEIKAFREDESNKIRGQKPTFNHAKRMVLIRSGVLSGSRGEAHANIAESRANMLAETAEQKGSDGVSSEEARITEKALKTMGLKRVDLGAGKKGFNKEAIARKLGGGKDIMKKGLDERKKNEHWGSGLLK